VNHDVGEVLVEIQKASQRGDRAALEEEFVRLRTWTIRWAPPPSYRVQRADREDIEQQFLFAIYRGFARSPPRAVNNPGAYARRIFVNVVRDHFRRGPRERPAAAAPPTVADPRPPEPRSARDHAEALGAIRAAIEQYATEARGGRGERDRQLRAWFRIRVERVEARAVARELGVADRAEGGTTTVYQWARRGAATARALADRDPCPARRELIRAALRATGR